MNTPNPQSAAETTVLLDAHRTPVGIGPSQEPHARLWSVGDAIEGRYTVVDIRGGRGVSGMGVVYILDDHGRRLAAKSFQEQFARNLPLIERFLREARTWLLTGFHPNIVHAHFLDIIEATPHVFMEYVESDAAGRLTLADHIAGGPLPLADVLRYAVQVCDGMIHATRAVPGLVHRDLKPENLLISPEGILKISDFGLVRCHFAPDPARQEPSHDPGNDSLTQFGSVFGTPAYMAPEQFLAETTVTNAADIYAFGCCLYEALAGKPPFPTEGRTGLERFLALKQFHLNATPTPLREAVPACPTEAHGLVMRCLAKRPGDRWSGFEEIRDRLLWILDRRFHVRIRPLPRHVTSDLEIEEQRASLALIEGYQRAIRLRNLRENQDNSPYAFHLALASYFHCHHDAKEERRQLEKAGRARGGHMGYEVARRLGDLLLAHGEFEQASALLETFLVDHPDSLDHILEPYVRVLLARGALDETERLLDSMPASLRTEVLRAELLHAQGDTVRLAGMARSFVENMLERIRIKLDGLAPHDVVGWAVEGDWDVLREALEDRPPTWNLAALDAVANVVWPDLSGYPDFSADMAWLSHGLGSLAELEDVVSAEDRERFARHARRLDYPERLRRHLERDEYWFWMTEDTDA